MLIRKTIPNEGICFAWTPRWTPEGTVWLEWVHYQWIDSGFGGWRYARFPETADYDAGKRRRFVTDEKSDWELEQERLHANPPSFYTTPPVVAKCRNIHMGPGAVACWHPHCTCMNVGGSICPEK